MPNQYHAVLFDLDGTLLDTLRDIGDSVNGALSSLGFPEHKIDAYKYFVGDGEDVLVYRALPEDRRDRKTVDRVLALFHNLYAVHWGDNTHPFPGIPDMLRTLTGVGVRTAILSNKGQGFVEATVNAFLPEWHFDVVLGAQPSIPTKPDPKGAFQVSTQMGLAPSEFLYLGDSGVDMKTAVAAGMYPVGAIWGYRKVAELLDAGAKALVKKPEDVPPLLIGE
jgi:phosphoglycolate phosphatase